MGHLYIAAAHKSSGKTSVSIGLTAAFVKRGLAVQTFKKGPDYIDPLWLSHAGGRPCYNLDFYTQSHQEIIDTFTRNMLEKNVGLIEGNKGLFDGIDVGGSDSNAALAKLLSTPVILVIDTAGITRGIAPLIQGYLGFDPEVNIAGVILNKVGGPRQESKLRAALERYTDVEVLGSVGRDAAFRIPERHLGLIPANEATGFGAAETMVSRLAFAVSMSVDLDRILEIANTAKLPSVVKGAPRQSQAVSTRTKPDLRIAIARDAAFGFYYQDDLEAFERAGAELVPFDTLKDKHLPECDGLFIGGGFPETQLDALAANSGLITEIREALAAGKPAYAECGGLMYLSRRISWNDQSADMVGAVSADTLVGDRPQGRGYMLLRESGKSPWPQQHQNDNAKAADIPAHEFHYARLKNLPEDSRFGYGVVRGTGIDGHRDGLIVNNLQAGFAHHRNTAANPWVERFVAFVRQKSA
ncbi:MAG: cobyrinate a,c-diamide synthase [Lysobacterales bacterium]